MHPHWVTPPSPVLVCCCPFRVPDGARLQLLVAMRGGPIQTAAGVSVRACVCVCVCGIERPACAPPSPVPMDDGSELRYDDEEEDMGQPLVLCRMWGTKVPLRRGKDKEKRCACDWLLKGQ